MTDDHVPSPLNSLRAIWAKKRAMTEDRVPARSGPRARDIAVHRLSRFTAMTEVNAEALMDRVESEADQPAPPLDVERLHAAIIWIRGVCRGDHIKDADCIGIAAEYERLVLARLGSAPSRAEPE